MQAGLCLNFSIPEHPIKLVGAVKTYLFFAVGDKEL